MSHPLQTQIANIFAVIKQKQLPDNQQPSNSADNIIDIINNTASSISSSGIGDANSAAAINNLKTHINKIDTLVNNIPTTLPDIQNLKASVDVLIASIGQLSEVDQLMGSLTNLSKSLEESQQSLEEERSRDNIYENVEITNIIEEKGEKGENKKIKNKYLAGIENGKVFIY
jgi:hypothetical protein